MDVADRSDSFPGLLTADDWAQLFRTFTIADAVVRKLSLYLEPKDHADAPLFRGFVLGRSTYAADLRVANRPDQKTMDARREAV